MNELMNFDPVSFVAHTVFHPTTEVADGCGCSCGGGCGLGAGSAGGKIIIQQNC